MEGTCEWKKGYTGNGFCLFLVLVVTIIIFHTYVYVFLQTSYLDNYISKNICHEGKMWI